jgi:cell filamentation protein
MSGGSDPYVYPGTDTLRNLANIRNPDELARFEAEATLRRVLELRQRPIEGEFDAAHLKAIHKHLFQDVYAWAGQFRTTVLGKQQFAGGPVTYFTPPHLLDREADRIFASLRRAGMWGPLSQRKFTREAALLLGALNTLHPFREGNGRCQRLFLEAVAQRAAYPLYFDVVSRERMVQASILSTNGDFAMMMRLFREITDPGRIAPLRRAITFLETNGFKWNDTYIATTTPEQTYSGRLAGCDQDAFMMRTDTDQIIIGNQGDISPEIRSGDHFSFTSHW